MGKKYQYYRSSLFLGISMVETSIKNGLPSIVKLVILQFPRTMSLTYQPSQSLGVASTLKKQFHLRKY